jgi:Rrf2 family transcriptional regulator, iron-sulfur cluster assembly transcription factor
MLLTKASEYALLSIFCISGKSEPIDVDTMASTIGISKSFLAKILQKLTKSGILKSYKGVKGGFVLARPISQISVLDIIRAVEENAAAVFECTSEHGCCPSEKVTNCMIWPTFVKLQGKIDKFLAELTLEVISAK